MFFLCEKCSIFAGSKIEIILYHQNEMVQPVKVESVAFAFSNDLTITEFYCLSSLVNFESHLPLVPHICVTELALYWFRWWLVAYSVPSHYLNQCLVIVNWNLRNKLQWNIVKNQIISFKKMHLKMSVKWRPFCPGEEELRQWAGAHKMTGHFAALVIHYGISNTTVLGIP